MLIRSFVAIEVPEPVRAEVSSLVRGLSGSPGVRWVRPDAMHLTLAFLGEREPGFVEAVKQALAAVGPKLDRFQARLAGLGAFPTPKRARVVWVGMEAGREECCRVQQATVAALASVGFVPESRKFSPHLTLGRLKVPADVSTLVGVAFRSGAFLVDRVVLFQSELRPEGPRYTRLGEYLLSGQ
ncbi:RNA 2',3'-cyclic phosphodiesterase [candidate division WOR-3 bacterium]|nr:RNA 2',3'-cyclic phosphodiesterase [candidate division WOR-3 bacterium]